MADSWDKMRGEPKRAHALFGEYLKLGPGRSLPRLARATSRSLSYLKKLSARWRWRERAAAWQQHLALSCLSPQEEDEAAQTRARQLKDARAFQQLGRAQILRWVRRDPQGKVWLSKQLTPHQAVRFWETGFHLEQELLPRIGEKEPTIDPQPPRKDADGNGESAPPLSITEALKRLARELRKAGLQGEPVYEAVAKVCRWLWLPEEEVEAIRPRARGKARRQSKVTRHGR